jgi:hypothetical protein
MIVLQAPVSIMFPATLSQSATGVLSNSFSFSSCLTHIAADKPSRRVGPADVGIPGQGTLPLLLWRFWMLDVALRFESPQKPLSC